jgi:hypothetical protein
MKQRANRSVRLRLGGCALRVTALLLLTFAAGSAPATDFFWQAANGMDGGFFDDPPHWTPTGPPNGTTANAIVAYVPGSPYTVTVRNNTNSIGTLTLDSPNVDFLDSGFQFTVFGPSDFKRGHVFLSGAASLVGNGTTPTDTIESPFFFTCDSGISTIRHSLINNGTFAVNGTLFFDVVETITNNSSFSLSLAGATVNVAGPTFTQAGGTLSMGPMTTFNVYNGGIFNFTGGAVAGTVFLNTATLNLGGGGGSGGFNFQGPNNTLTGNVLLGQAITLQSSDANSVAIVGWSTPGFTNRGQITLTSSGTAARNTILNIAGGNTLVNMGQIDLAAGVGGTRFINADAITNNGTINVNANTTLSAAIGSGATLAITNTKGVNIAPGSTLTINSTMYTQTAGVTQNNGSLVMNPATGTIQIQGGVFQGTGSVTGKVQVSGSGTRLAPGNSIGTLTITGNVAFAGDSGLAAELGAAGSPGSSDLLAIGGNLDLSGATDALDITGGAPGGFYTILTYTGTRSGTFDLVTPGYTVDYSHAGEIRVTGVPEPTTLLLIPAIAAFALVRRSRSRSGHLPNARRRPA